MAEYSFTIGESVLFRPRASRGINAPPNQTYRITHRLAEALGEPHYRIRCAVTGIEFVVSDKELRPSELSQSEFLYSRSCR
jgi:hypothetical protein